MTSEREHLGWPGGGREGGLLGRLSAGVKLAGALAFLLAVVLTPRDCAAGLWAAASVIGLAMAAGRVSPKAALRRMLAFEPVVLGVAGLAWFQPDGGRIFLVALAKANLCLLATFILAWTTSFSDLIRALQRWRVPWIFVTTFTLMHRYVFVLAEESERMKRARASRAFTAGRRFQWLALSTVAGQLFVRASERAERIYSAMCARGWK